MPAKGKAQTEGRTMGKHRLEVTMSAEGKTRGEGGTLRVLEQATVRGRRKRRRFKRKEGKEGVGTNKSGCGTQGSCLALVAMEGGHSRHVIQGPDSDASVERCGVQLVGALPEGQPRNDISMPLETLRQVPIILQSVSQDIGGS